jgi:hypothetical protein
MNYFSKLNNKLEMYPDYLDLFSISIAYFFKLLSVLFANNS